MKNLFLLAIAFYSLNSIAQTYSTTTTTKYSTVEKTYYNRSNEPTTSKTVVKKSTPMERQLTVDEKIDKMNNQSNTRSTDSKLSIDEKLETISNQNKEIILSDQRYIQNEISNARTPKSYNEPIVIQELNKSKTNWKAVKIFAVAVAIVVGIGILTAVDQKAHPTTY